MVNSSLYNSSLHVNFVGVTLKPLNFGPHGNFGLLFPQELAMIEMRPTEK
jgi:hypothetical protein